MRVLVTGAEGVLGTVMCNHLADCGHTVVGLDIREPPQERVWTAITGSVLDAATLARAGKGCDALVNLAADGDIYSVEKNLQSAITANVQTAIAVGEYCAEMALKLIHASTWEVYGAQSTAVAVEESEPCFPDNHYSITKLGAELHLRCLVKEDLLTILRLGTLYGPSMRRSGVVNSFLSSAYSGQDLTVYGDGTQARQFLYEKDAVEAFERFLHVPSGTFNVVGPRQLTVNALASSIAARFGVGVSHVLKRNFDPQSLVISSRLTEFELGWLPSTDFELGLTECVNALH